jgi:hypothetical protein
MKGTDRFSPPLPSSHHRQFTLTNIYKCLVPCKECTGNYVSEILQKRFICNCRCHYVREDNFASATTSDRGQEIEDCAPGSNQVQRGGLMVHTHGRALDG